ncbi:MAG TPA: histidinol dehydrogenase [Thermoanaerobaculia bacterium]|nr:histidinol dehydrogenase [Thermoanaerobaculia bacterium]
MSLSRRGLLPIVRVDSRRGQRVVARLADRHLEVLPAKLVRRVERIVARVRSGGDAALLDLVRRLDHPAGEASAPRSIDAVRLPLGDPAVEGRELSDERLDAVHRAIEAVVEYHREQTHAGFVHSADGVRLEERRRPLARVGCYVPGGRASYPSTAIMTVVPACVAGVGEVVVVTPPGSFSPTLRYTLARLGVDEVWGMGGAHAVAALAYGTASLRRVDKIVGPGNAWVTAAKRLVAGDVGIDGIAGPSEVVIAADGDADPALVAADLLAQAEHDPRAAALLITTDRRLAVAVERELEAQLAALPTAETARRSLASFGHALLVADADAALALIEELAPEHLQLVGTAMEGLADRVDRAGAIFVGAETGEVFGDYVAGPSHVLPTGGSARFASGLGVDDFVRRSHVVRLSAAAAARLAGPAAELADAEGLPAHAAAAGRRSG